MNRQALIGVAVSVACLVYVLWDVDWPQMWLLVRQVNPLYVVGINLLLAVSFVVRSLRWQVLLSPVQKCSFGPLMSANLIGFMANNVLPARLGELVRAYAASRLAGPPVSSLLATIVVERVLDGMTLLLVIFVTLLFCDPQAQASYFNVAYLRMAGLGMLVVYLGVLAVILGLMRWPVRTTAMFTWLAGKISPRLAEKLGGFLAEFIKGLAVLGRGRSLPWLLLLSAGVWTPVLFMFLVFLPAVGLPAELFPAAMAMVGGVMAAAVPAGPGYIGTTQLAISWCLMMAGVAEDKAVAFSVIYWAAQYFPLVIAGLMEMWRRGMSLGGLSRAGRSA